MLFFIIASMFLELKDEYYISINGKRIETNKSLPFLLFS